MSRVELLSVAGRIEVWAPYGQDPDNKQWLCPLRQRLGLEARQMITPELQERLCYTATQTRSYEAAAETAQVWGVPASMSVIYKHVQRIGAQRRQRHEEQVERALNVETRAQVVAQAAQEAPKAPFSLVLMIDAWKIRERGQQWGAKPPEAPGERVEWRDVKSGIVFRLEDRAETQSGRRIVLEKHIEAYRGDPHEFGRRLFALALQRGLMQARTVYVVADGAVWIWNLAADRFPYATALLDFYHASQHLWAVARALYPEDSQARAWVEPMLRQLRHGEETGVLKGLQGLKNLLDTLAPDARAIVQTEQNYFENNKDRLGYQDASVQGCPVGSGAMESTCAQLQNRFKRTGQFWVFNGHSNLMALDVARRNKNWKDIWLKDAA
jgi:hypothetical protein